MHLPLYIFVIAYFFVANCSNAQTRVGEDTLVQRADSLFSVTPKIYDNVEQAYRLLRQALDDFDGKDARRFDATADAALCAIWLALHDKDRSDILKHASEAMSFSLKVISLDKDRAEGYYYRAIATGLFAEQNKSYGRQSMNEIRANGEKALALNPKFDHAGPHRLLGALYLRAPGPPSGIGSLRKAIEHLEQAVTTAPDYSENLIFLAEAYLKSERRDEAARMLDRASAAIATEGQLADPQKWKKQIDELQARLRKSP